MPYEWFDESAGKRLSWCRIQSKEALKLWEEEERETSRIMREQRGRNEEKLGSTSITGTGRSTHATSRTASCTACKTGREEAVELFVEVMGA
jgi:hypothetical protein